MTTSTNAGTNSLGNHHHSHNSMPHNNNSASNNHHHHSVIGNGNKVPNDSNSVGSGVDFVRSSGTSSALNSNGVTSTGSMNGIGGVDRRERDDRGSSRGIDRERERDRDKERARDRERDRDTRDNNSASGTNSSHNDFLNVGASRHAGNSSATQNVTNNATSTANTSNYGGNTSPTITSTSRTSEYPDYLTYYTTISSLEQRRRYKDEFNADYEDYRRFHAEVERVSRRFTQLEERRQREIENENYERSESIKQQIKREYAETTNDPVHKEL